jgi:hypothetical protein
MVSEKSIVRRRLVPPLTLLYGDAELPVRLIYDGSEFNHIQGIAPPKSLQRSAKIENYIASWFWPVNRYICEADDVSRELISESGGNCARVSVGLLMGFSRVVTQKDRDCYGL